MPLRYKNPSIMETVFEARFPAELPWDNLVPDDVYHRLREQLPLRESRVIEEVRISQESGTPKRELSRRSIAIFTEASKQNLVQLGERLLTVNCVGHYPGWQAFSRSIAAAYCALSNACPFEVLDRVGLRYINKFEIQAEAFHPEEWFAFGPFPGKALPIVGVRHVSLLYELGCNDLSNTCRLAIRSVASGQPEAVAFVLDLDYFPVQARSIRKDQAMDWTARAHVQISAIFESCITDRMRDFLGRED